LGVEEEWPKLKKRKQIFEEFELFLS